MTNQNEIPGKIEIVPDLLLHVCCGPCACGCFPQLMEQNREYTFYFSNSNLCSQEEYEKRLNAIRTLADYLKVPLIVDPYRHDLWLESVSQCFEYREQPERGSRCAFCFRYSLTRTAEKAKELGMNFATTLTVSPHKNANLIFSIGSQWDNFEPWDFKKRNGFLMSIRNSKNLGLYRQNFCGCEFSLR